jgi:hypothetical protein
MERFGGDAVGLAADLERAGIDPRGFGVFDSEEPSRFDYERAMPILIRWPPLVETADLKEVIARGMTGEPSAAGEGARELLSEFRKASVDEQGLKWAIGNAVSTLADPSIADDLIDLLGDQTQGSSRQMLCEALRRTEDPRAPEVLTDLIGDPEVGGMQSPLYAAMGQRVRFRTSSTLGQLLKASSQTHARATSHDGWRRNPSNASTRLAEPSEQAS